MKPLLLVLSAMLTIAVNAQPNWALTFNGSSQYVTIGTPLSNNTSYTKEAWVFTNNTGGNRNIISSNNAPFWITGGTLSAGHAGNYSIVTEAGFPTGVWTHVAVTYDAATTTMRLYRNGNIVASNTGVASNYAAEPISIGAHVSVSIFDGAIDEVRIWNVARTQADIKRYMYSVASNASGLVAYYRINEGSGSTLVNATGGTNGTIVNTPSWTASPVTFSKNAINFDGVNDVVNIPEVNSSLDITAAITLEAWVYATKNSGIQNVISKSATMADNIGYIFPRTNDGWANVVFYLFIGGSWRVLTAPYNALSQWHHLAATYDGATMKLYIDGVLANSMAQTGAIATNNVQLALGNQTGFSENFGGSADEFRVWNVARTQAQIQASMNKELDPSTQTGLVSYYTANGGIASGTNTGLVTLVDQQGTHNGVLANFAMSGTSSNYVSQNISLITLPVTYLSFTAQQQADKVLLKWSTAMEQNSTEFIIEHSTDALTWKNIGSVAAAGNSSSNRYYDYTHNAPVAGLNFYRLDQKDADGQTHFSEIRSVKTVEASRSLVLENPVSNGKMLIRITQPQFLSFYNNEGKLLFNKKYTAGTHDINVSRHPKGIYWLKTNKGTEKILLQ